MSETRLYIPADLRAEVERAQSILGDEKLSQTCRRLIRLGLKEIKKVEEG
jgi:hypothetical protein